MNRLISKKEGIERRNWTQLRVAVSYDLKRRSNFKSLNSRGQIGQILTSFPSLVFVFVIMLIFVILSGFVAKDSSSSETIMDKFLATSVVIDGKYVPVNDAFDILCKDEALSSTIGIALREHFKQIFGEKYAFAFGVRYNGGLGGYGYRLYSWYGAFSDRYSEDKPKVDRFKSSEFFIGEVEGVKQKKFCNTFILSVKGGNS